MPPSEPPAGNQRARKHGWFSAVDPPSLELLLAEARGAIVARDPALLRVVARAVSIQGHPAYARHLRQLALRLSRGVPVDPVTALKPPGEPDPPERHEPHVRAILDALAEGAAAVQAVVADRQSATSLAAALRLRGRRLGTPLVVTISHHGPGRRCLVSVSRKGEQQL